MAVLLECSAGELVIDLLTEECPLATKNFLKLCEMKYYNGCLFYNVQQNYICQTGDPTGSGDGGTSIYGILGGNGSVSFKDEINKQRKMNKVGLVCMAHDPSKENANKSQFFITLRGEDLDNLDGKYTIFGEIAEGLEVLQKINELYCDGDGRPYQDVRIKHTYILDDPFDDLPGLNNLIPPSSPERAIPEKEKVKKRIPYEEGVETKVDARSEAELEQSIRSKEAKSRAIVLEMTGDIPDADVKPPDEVLFVCKLNSVTTDADLELIFSRFGTIKQCDIIKDFKTGDSLSYAFIEFETADSCIEAYEKMNNVLVDDRRIKVDFSQSVSHLWNRFLSKPRANKSQGKGAVPQNQQKSSYKPPSNLPPQDQQQHQHNQQQQQKSHQQSQEQGHGQQTHQQGRDSGPPKGQSRWSSNENRDKPDRNRQDSRERNEKQGGSHIERALKESGTDRDEGNRDRDGRERHRRSRSGSRDRNRGDRGNDRKSDKSGDYRRDSDRGRDGRNIDRNGDQNSERNTDKRDRDTGSNRGTDRSRSRSKDRNHNRDSDRDRERGRERGRDNARDKNEKRDDRDRKRDGGSRDKHRRSRSRS